jgi:hypothetical protein
MMRAAFVGLAATAMLCGCDVSIGDDPAKSREDVKVQMAKTADGERDRISVKLPFIDASVSVADLNLGENIELDEGMTLAPGTKVSGLNVDAGGVKGQDLVTIAFTNPSPPRDVAQHYRNQFTSAGYAISGTAAALRGAKDAKRFAVDTSPDGNGTRGEMRITKD